MIGEKSQAHAERASGGSVKALLLSACDPSCQTGGGVTYTQNLIKLIENDRQGAQVKPLYPGTSVLSSLAGFRKLRQAVSLVRSPFSPLPAKALFWKSRGYLRAIRTLLAQEDFDLVLIDGGDLLWVLPELPGEIPKILVCHNLEHKLFRSHVESLNLRSRTARQVLLREQEKLEAFEVQGITSLRNVIAISSEEAAEIERILPGGRIFHVPPIFSHQPYSRARSDDQPHQLNIGFLAKFTWWPNREGAEWFIAKVLPGLGAHVRLHLFGSGSENFSSRDGRIVPHGFVREISDIWKHCDFMICPTFSGAGVNVKLAEYLYNGMPVLATRLATRGLRLPAEPCIKLLDRAEDWVEFLQSSAVAEFRSTAVPSHVSSMFAASSYSEAMQQYLAGVLQRDGRQVCSDIADPVG